MQTRRGNRILAVGLLSATLCLAGGYMLTASPKKTHCKGSGTPCDYYDAKGQTLPGHCGPKKEDKEHCYCIADSNKQMSQLQEACSASQ